MTIAPINYIEIRNDRAIVAGTGIKVSFIGTMHVKNHTPIEWIIENYDLTPAQVHAALSYYYDHQEQLDKEVAEGDELAQKIGTPSSEVLARMRKRLEDRKDSG
jgi:uncharacterized protein (DUF433 family)